MFEDSEGNSISRKKMKKLRKIMRRPVKDDQQNGRSGEICVNVTCPNPLVSNVPIYIFLNIGFLYYNR